jgi:DNA-binding IclR family transcriptional regulator
MRSESRTVNAESRAPATPARLDPEASGSLAPAVTRAAAILDLLAENPAIPTPLSDLARRLGLPKSSVANITGALVEAGLAQRADSGFRLGRRLAELGGAYLATVDQVQQFQELADHMPVASEETMQMAVLDGLEVTYVARHDGRQPIRLASDIGRRLPASCTALGKAALASLEPDELAERLHGVEMLPALTRNSHRRVADLLDDLDDVRRRGYAVDNEETAEGIVCLGVAIPRRAADAPYAISVTLLKARAEDSRRDALAADLRRLARLLSHPLAPGDDAGTRAEP